MDLLSSSVDMIGRLQGWLDGDGAARDQSVETADEVIRQIVQRRVHTAPEGTAFDAAGLLAEALEQLIELRLVPWTQRARFFTVAVRLVRTLVVQRHRAAVEYGIGKQAAQTITVVAARFRAQGQHQSADTDA